MPKKRRQKPRVVPAPEPTVSSACLPNRVVSVVLRPGEQVRWIWTYGPEGQYVSGYTIVNTRRFLDRLWAKEAEERLAAYRRGELKALPLEKLLAKYRAK